MSMTGGRSLEDDRARVEEMQRAVDRLNDILAAAFSIGLSVDIKVRPQHHGPGGQCRLTLATVGRMYVSPRDALQEF